ncbi:MAG: Uma2 family endonuclease [Gemmatimonadetes bacterium]|nr:Uma2 family endonuclease [Gemmatimonadota bacterium]
MTASRMTAEELLHLPEDHQRHELIRGVLTTMPPAGFEHGAVAVRLASSLHAFVRAQGLGLVLAAETGFKIAADPDTVRAPDAAFVRKERIAALGIPRGYFPGAPDLAAEVVSPDDTTREVREKVEDWIQAGAAVVWVIDPRARTVSIHDRAGSVTTLDETAVLTARELLPGWSCEVSALFL